MFHVFVDLFKETGDRLTIPRTIYLETDSKLESVFKTLITSAGTTASKGKVQITIVRDKLKFQSKQSKNVDVPLLVAGSFFHTSDDRSHFEYL